MGRFSKVFTLLVMVMLLFADKNCFAQINVLEISKADSAMQKEAKPLLILLSTDWCKFCYMQKSQLRKNKDFMFRTSNSFYYVEFDAERTDSIFFKGHTYSFNAHGSSTGVHELAEALNGSERIAFPTWVLLDKECQVLFRYNGVLSIKQLNELLNTINEINKL